MAPTTGQVAQIFRRAGSLLTGMVALLDRNIQLYRKIRNNPIFNSPDILRLWLLCLMEATHTEHQQLIGHQVITLQPGEFVTGRYAIAEIFNRGLKKTYQRDPKTIWNMLTTLAKFGCLSIKSTNKFSVITVINWGKYQTPDLSSPTNLDNKRPPNIQQEPTNNNANKKKKEKKENKISISYSFDFMEFWHIYPRKVGKIDAFTEWRRIIERGESPELIQKCARNYANFCSDNNTEYVFIKHPATFLKSERYLDFLNPIERKVQSHDETRTSIRFESDKAEDRESQRSWQQLVIGAPKI